jgi:predicted nucleic acid-binding protein
MIVLDTNVISEIFKPRPDPGVMAWLQRQEEAAVFTTAVTRGELLYGVAIRPAGREKESLLAGLLRIFEVRFPDRVLPYDSDAADAHAVFAAMRRMQGRPTSHPDAMIAGIVRSRGAILATRNVRDFEGCDVALIDPWNEAIQRS